MKKKSEFLSGNFQFLVVKYSIYQNRRVFIMRIIDKTPKEPASDQGLHRLQTLIRRRILRRLI